MGHAPYIPGAQKKEDTHESAEPVSKYQSGARGGHLGGEAENLSDAELEQRVAWIHMDHGSGAAAFLVIFGEQ